MAGCPIVTGLMAASFFQLDTYLDSVTIVIAAFEFYN